MKRNPNSTFKKSLSYDFWKYLIIPISLSVLFYFVYQASDALKNYEKVEIFTNFQLKDKDLNIDFLPSIKEEGTLQIYHTYSQSDDAYTQTLLNARGLSKCDVLILSEKYDVEWVKDKVINLEGEILDKIDNSGLTYDYSTYNEEIVGIKIFDKDNESYNSQFEKISSYYDIDETSYLFLTKASVNIGEYNEKSYTDSAIKCFYYLLGL